MVLCRNASFGAQKGQEWNREGLEGEIARKLEVQGPRSLRNGLKKFQGVKCNTEKLEDPTAPKVGHTRENFQNLATPSADHACKDHAFQLTYTQSPPITPGEEDTPGWP